MTGSRLTLADIAAQAGVSLPTVSKVLNGRSGVSPERRDSILRLLDEQG
ncbi:MAG: helix-turn-helix domain-containing protein, partial [Propionibacteriaceae bacterium]|nr:helix-turn-helix domain-containing protein [Propionibacteriaceae bacterium]